MSKSQLPEKGAGPLTGFNGWSFEGNVNIEADYWVDEVEFDNVVITDEEIDEVVKQESDKTQVGQ